MDAGTDEALRLECEVLKRAEVSVEEHRALQQELVGGIPLIENKKLAIV